MKYLLFFLSLFCCAAKAPDPQQNIPVVYEDNIICSSVLLDSTHILTAAHCVKAPVMDFQCGGMTDPRSFG